MKPFHFSLRGRIFLSMTAILLLSLAITSFIAVTYFQKQNKRYHMERLIRKEAAVNNSLNFFMRQGSFNHSDEGIAQVFTGKISELAAVENIQINVFNLQGELLVTSARRGEYIPEDLPEAILEKLKQNKGGILQDYHDNEGQHILQLISYLEDLSGEPFGIIFLPYHELQQIQGTDFSGFFKEIVKGYSLLLLIATGIALLLSRYIAGSLAAIGARLKEIRMDERTEPIQWRYKDEIGVLVAEYNEMLSELEKSAIKLAQNERESAWKEMAKQVAHEIKNPLTPMRLNVQFLERSLKVDNPEKLKAFTNAMLDQIDTLSSIAESFSRFANLPELKMERLDIADICMRTISLHPDSNILFDNQLSTVTFVNADRDQMVRVLNNLIKNAQQAIPDNRTPEIALILKEHDGTVSLEVKDNGVGIPKEQLESIFEPSFTTKSKGMGLGLSMVRNILKGIGGEVAVVSEINKGASFIIALQKG